MAREIVFLVFPDFQILDLTGYLRFGDELRLEMYDREGRSIFGAISQQVRRWPGEQRG